MKPEKSFGEIWSELTQEQSEYLKGYINRQRIDAINIHEKVSANQIEKLKADKAELLEALEKVKRLEPIICMGGAVAEQWQNEAQALNEMMSGIESLIQKMKKCQENTPR